MHTPQNATADPDTSRDFESAESVGRRLHSLRTAKGLSLSAVGGHIGVSKSCVCQWEKGRNYPGPTLVKRLVELLGTSESYVFTGKHLSLREAKNAGLFEKVISTARREVADALGVDARSVTIEVKLKH